MKSDLRDYAAIAAKMRPGKDAMQIMKAVVDSLWDALHDKGLSWVGFYLDQPGQPDDRRMTLGPCRDKPACSPIGVHGVCGQAMLSRKTQIVRDVRELGPNYVACDPRDQAEIVIPIFDSHDRCWAVLDVDSWEIGAFEEADADGLRVVLSASGLKVG